ncbi:MAG: DUF4394 domain-containing protein [Jiangellaceae bacterium]
MRRTLLTALLTLALGVAATVLVAAKPETSPGQPDASRRDQSAQPFLAVGLTDDQTLVAFASNNPRNVKTIGRISGLQGDQSFVGIDRRVQDGNVYGVGDRGGIYTLGLRDATATKVSQLTVALQGSAFDIDFNPAANRLRVISDTGQNLRHNIDDPAGTPAPGQTANDTALTIPPAAETAIGVTGAAYTNNDLDPATATTLFALDTSRDQVAIQSPANAGLLAATGKLGVDVDAGSDAGFDIHNQPGPDGISSGGRGLAALMVDGAYALYEVDVLTGEAHRVGAFPAGRQVIDLTTAGLRHL